jgi:hypothetical protein
MSKQDPTYCAPGDIPEDARATYNAAVKLNGELSAILKGASFDVATNAIVNLLIAQAVHGDRQMRDDMRTVLNHAVEYINRLDMQAPSGATVN